MTTLETVALDQRRWSSTALSLKDSNWARYQLMAALIVAGAILEAVALQTHASYPAVSQLAGYAGAAALVLVLVVRTKGLQRERAQAWVLAAAAGQSLMSEMYRYRTSSHPYSDHFGKDPEATLLRRRDAIFEKVKLIEKYIVETDPKPLPPLGALDADAYIAERVNGEVDMLRKYSKHLPQSQAEWLRREYVLASVAALAALVLTFTHNQVYSVWVIIVAFLSVVLGASTKLERYATLAVELRSMPDRLTGILEKWRANQGTLQDLVERIEAAILAGAESWIAVPDEDVLEDVSLSGPSSLEPVLQAPASRVDA
jgi:NADH:ubiquinone oxidoreductase subunit 6 (subunit J)